MIIKDCESEVKNVLKEISLYSVMQINSSFNYIWKRFKESKYN